MAKATPHRAETKEKYKDEVDILKEGSWDKRLVKYYDNYIVLNINKSGWWTVKELGWKVSVRIVVSWLGFANYK